MPNLEEIKTWHGREVHGPDGEKIGKIDQIYLDRQSGEPTFVAVKTGLFGSNVSLVPVEGAGLNGEDVRVSFDKAKIKDAPNIDADAELSPEEEQRLYEYYGHGYSEWDGDDATEAHLGPDSRYATGTTGTTGTAGIDTADRDVDTTDRDVDTTRGAGHDTSGPNTDDAMTRSEEELRVGTTQRETGRARLRKYIVTENVQQTVPVQREEVRIEREPITDANVDQALSGGDLTEEEHEVTLRAQEPVVEKRVVPKERVRLDKETTTEDVQVDDEIRKERIEAEGDVRDRDAR